MRQQQSDRIAVAMSGGVDSSAAAILLQEQGYPLFGITMQLPTPQELLAPAETLSGTEPEYIRDARHAAQTLGIDHLVVDVRRAFQEQIVSYFCDAYRTGRTPNPCVFCNPQIKFGLLFEEAQLQGARKMATGHYVSSAYLPQSGRYSLQAGSALAKDQSYFLYRLTQEQLARSLFPLAPFTKAEIRQKARERHLVQIAEKAESQENCFISGQRYQQFLDAYLPAEAKLPGPIADTSGNVLGEHQGIYRYTVGQRRGLGIALGSPRYVVALDPETNTVIIGENHELLTTAFLVTRLNFITIDRLTAPLDLHVKIRYRTPATPARVQPGSREDEVQVVLQTPQRAVTPGQSAVFYADDQVVAGGIITTRLSEYPPCPAVIN